MVGPPKDAQEAAGRPAIPAGRSGERFLGPKGYMVLSSQHTPVEVLLHAGRSVVSIRWSGAVDRTAWCRHGKMGF